MDFSPLEYPDFSIIQEELTNLQFFKDGEFVFLLNGEGARSSTEFGNPRKLKIMGRV
jgi:hypothetical protein